MKYIKLFEAFGDGRPFEVLAKQVMDFISEFKTDRFITSKEADEVAEYHGKEENEPWEEAPHKDKVDNALNAYIIELKKEFPYFNDKAVNATDGTFLEGKFGQGFPYGSELNALTHRLEKSGITIPNK